MGLPDSMDVIEQLAWLKAGLRNNRNTHDKAEKINFKYVCFRPWIIFICINYIFKKSSNNQVIHYLRNRFLKYIAEFESHSSAKHHHKKLWSKNTSKIRALKLEKLRMPSNKKDKLAFRRMVGKMGKQFLCRGLFNLFKFFSQFSGADNYGIFQDLDDIFK